MPSPVQIGPGETVVDAAIREGRFPESRRAHYTGLLAKKPKKTTRLIHSLEPVLSASADDQVAMAVSGALREREVAATRETYEFAEDAQPTGYPKEWLATKRPARASVGQPGSHDPITFETESEAAQAMALDPRQGW